MEKKNTQKRGRGRPRKHPKPTEGVLDIPAEVAVAQPSPACHDGVLTIPDAKAFVEEVLRRELDAIVDALRRELPIVARLAAADTRHSAEPAEKVFDRAIKEGRLAAAVWSAQNEVRE